MRVSTMLWKEIQFLCIITFCNVLIKCEVQQERPKIKTSNGDLIIEPAFNKNIYLRRNGPKSSVYLGGLNILNINTTSSQGYQPASGSDFESDLQDVNSISERLQRLENQNNQFPSDFLLNITVLSRKINRLNNRVSILRTQMSRKVNNCESNPCRHGGTCLNLVTGYHCLCPSNWEGPKCEDDVNECRNYAGTDLGCQNGATCINKPGSYDCLCKTGWFGLHCTRKAKDCTGGDFEMCGHGICLTVTSGDGIKCICDQGWKTNGTGIACLTDVNECEQGTRCSVNPRVECINLPGSFRCGNCPPGFEGNGYVCYDIDECLTLPNGGCSITPFVTCHNTIGSRICGPCPTGYQGDGVSCTWRGSCSVNNGGCHPSASCVESRFDFTGRTGHCVCPNGMYGDGIGVHGCYVPNSGNVTLQCEDNPCGDHGYCHSLRTGYTCICHKGFNGVHCENTENLCQSNPCQNGGSCRLDESSSSGFRCECTALYSGDLCESHATLCGGVLNHDVGNILYPLTNATYNHNARCAWVIHTRPEKVINVTFSKFNLESSPDCLYDFLQIHDGRSSASQLIGRFCGSEFPKGGNIISSHNTLYFWFRSDLSIAKEGFALHWSSVNPVCGGEIDASTHGHISSPGSPGKYPPNRDCYWHLTTAIGKRIQLHFFALDIESHVNCSFDFIAIYDGGHIRDPLLEKYCNSTQPAPLQSAGSELLIYFHSDAYNSGFGFQIAYAPVEGIPGCGGYFTEYRGEITSPTYNGKYINNLKCEYKIKTSEDTKIRINFVSFSLENSFRCKYDYIKIYDGPSSDSRFVGKFCGTLHPKSYTSSSNMLFIIFKSDHTMASEGFKITYESICHKQLHGDSGIIKSPGYPFSYPENKVCEYIINTTPGKAIQLTFQDFNIENNSYSNCQYDNVEIRDGPDINSTLLGRFCGSELLPPVQTSTFNYMYIRFKSDMSITGTGFYANYTTIDTECGGIHRDTTGVISHPSDGETTYKNEQSCTWMIIAPEGMHIKLTWDRFRLENQIRPTCTSDFVELYEIDDDNQRNLLGRYCGITKPPVLTSSTNRIMIKFESDNSIRESGFALSYSFVDERSHCGAFLVKSRGYIYSPGWPNVYEPNRDCVWTITVPVGQQIKLNISQFDLERPIRDKCDLGDYLEIRNGATENTPLIGKFCGKFKSKRIISAANSLYLHFHSDFYLTGHGFKIEWDGTITGCGGTLTSANGSISSPNYPDNYHENAECFYRIVTSAGSRIRISFTELSLEMTRHCMDDYVEIFDGRDTSAVSLGKYCEISNALRNIETSSNYAYIKFRSDFFISSKGFLLNYNTICQCNITGNFGVIESPGFPSNYPHYANCLWTITVPRGNKINVTFTHFDIFKTNRNFAWWKLDFFVVRTRAETCDSDFVQISETDGTSVTEKLCGSTLPKQINVQSNILNVKFKSGGYFTRSGFRLEWVKDGCGGLIQKRFGFLSLDKRMALAENEINCEWIIETPLGSSATISFTELYMYDSKNCTEDAIEVYNGQTVDAPLLTRICHRDLVQVQGSSNFLLIRFIKKSSLRNVYFNSHFDSFKSGCGGKMMAHTGIIYSKNYPKNYDDNLDCVWSLIVPKNHRIRLNMLEFDLYSEDNEDSPSCGDKINIYETSNIFDANYTYHICPKTNISEIISKTNQLSLQFLTNDYGSAKGFKASFIMICGARIIADRDGVINNKFLQDSNDTCTWTLLAPTPSLKIKLTITHMSIPKYTIDATNTSRSCPASFLRILDGDDEDSPLIDEYCGNKVPPMIVSHGSAMTIQLGSYDGKISGMFSAHYTTLTSACGGILTSEEGTIASPNYPQSYPHDSDCEWILSTSPGNKVYITFEELNLEYSEGCNEDYLEVREDNGGGRLIGVFCGNVLPTNTTSASKLYIKFHSDSKDSGRGFVIHYGFLHGNNIIGLTRGEITSPLYPNTYKGGAEYTWRVTIKNPSTIALRIDKLEIHNQGATCQNYLAFYDGYDEDAPLLEEICGIITNQIKSLKTTSGVVYIKLHLEESNIGSLFHLHWEEADKDEGIVTGENPNCGFNHTEILAPGHSVTFTSPNYPLLYGSDLHCVWVFKSTPGRHLLLSFQDFSLEETQNCFADKINIYSSSSLDNWTPIKENICENEAIKVPINASTYLKVSFKTDVSVARKGFSAKVASMCGGELLNSGVIEPTWFDMQNVFSSMMRCEWKLKVRPGRNMKIVFENFNITSSDCSSYVIIHNGETKDSPLLGDGRYCGYTHEKLNDITSSSNAVFISSVTYVSRDSLPAFKNFKIRFEELNIVCGVTSSLDLDHPWEVISSPNYPSVPPSYTECVWVFIGPPGEILRIDFIERFDLEKSDSCASEYVEIRDGSTRISPIKGRYCGEKPGTIKTSNNLMFIKYSTQLSEPRNGFKANISIDVCGGTIVASEGTLTSPGYPHMSILPYGTICKWNIIGPSVFSLKLQLKDLNLPDSVEPCATKLTISENSIPVNNTVTVLKEFCNDDIEEYLTPIESFTNQVTIAFSIGKPNDWDQISDNRGFKLTFSSWRSICGGTVTTSEGFLTTPGYPRLSTLRFCQWKIKLPNSKRRVRLELLDFDLNNHRIGIYNDVQFQTVIEKIPDKNYTTSDTVFESSGSTLGIYVWLRPSGIKTHRFKAQFTSNDEALCGGDLSGNSGELLDPDLQRSYECAWHYNNEDVEVNSNLQYNTMVIQANVNVSSTSKSCRFTEPRLIIKSTIMKDLTIIRTICGKNKEETYRYPSNVVDLIAVRNKDKVLNFHLKWKLQPCGGVIYVSEEKINVLNLTRNDGGSIDCGWVLVAPPNSKIEIKLEGEFQLDCSNEFIQITQGTGLLSTKIGDYCKDRIPQNPLITTYRYTFVDYHSSVKNSTKIKLNVRTASNQCGGILTKHERQLSSPNFPKNYIKNQECIWEIKAEIGNRVSLQFIERFVIEDTPNCTKDAVIIYDWKDDMYTEVAKLCGRRLPPAYNSTYNQMKVVFRTDSDINLDGFRAQWSSICGGLYIATEKEQILYSPGYNNGYLPSLKCEYRFTGKGYRIELKFLTFDIEGTFPLCEYDNVTLSAHSQYDYVYQAYCGNELPSPLKNVDEVQMVLSTDRYSSRKGFKLSYSIYTCGGKVNNNSHVIKFDKYERDLNCTWIIEAPVNKIVVLRFDYIDLESNPDCYNDYIAVYNGLSIDNDERLALMCGHVNSTTTIKGRGNEALLQFVTDSSVAYTGFQVEIIFSYSESAGCGGQIDLTPTSSHTLKSPLIGNSFVYENYLDCTWYIKAPQDYVVNVEFISFHISSCFNVNQTALGFSKCDCDYVEFKDGINPNSINIGTYCGHTLPSQIHSTYEYMSIHLATDGEIASSGFEAVLSTKELLCGQSVFTVTNNVQTLKSPGYDSHYILRDLHCSYRLISERYTTVRLSIKNLDLQLGSTDINKCDKDYLLITNNPYPYNMSIGKEFILNPQVSYFFDVSSFYEQTFPSSTMFCGVKKSVDLYVNGEISMYLKTAPFAFRGYRGFEIEFVKSGFCGRNYTDSQGRIKSLYPNPEESKDCYTLITAPDHHTVALYFMFISPDYDNDKVYLDIFDGDKTTSPLLVKYSKEAIGFSAVFSTGRSLLLHNHGGENNRMVSFDLNYVATDKDRGCGGKLNNVVGRIMSPLYPEVYRQKNTCEWELETPHGTHLMVHFEVFDLGVVCDQNYLQLADRNGNTISTYCSEMPADYKSSDNYVKIIFTTNMNNGGTGWVADFVAIV